MGEPVGGGWSRFSAMEVVIGGETSIGSSDHSSQSQRSEK